MRLKQYMANDDMTGKRTLYHDRRFQRDTSSKWEKGAAKRLRITTTLAFNDCTKAIGLEMIPRVVRVVGRKRFIPAVTIPECDIDASLADRGVRNQQVCK